MSKLKAFLSSPAPVSVVICIGLFSLVSLIMAWHVPAGYLISLFAAGVCCFSIAFALRDNKLIYGKSFVLDSCTGAIDPASETEQKSLISIEGPEWYDPVEIQIPGRCMKRDTELTLKVYSREISMAVSIIKGSGDTFSSNDRLARLPEDLTRQIYEWIDAGFEPTVYVKRGWEIGNWVMIDPNLDPVAGIGKGTGKIRRHHVPAKD